MAEMTNYLEGAVYDAVLRNTTYTAGATLYLALHTADPTETGAVGELSAINGYARETVAFGTDTDGSGTNSGLVSFTASGGNWGTITHFSIWDAASAGNSLLYSALDNNRVVNDGDTIEFAIGAITVTFA